MVQDKYLQDRLDMLKVPIDQQLLLFSELTNVNVNVNVNVKVTTNG